LEGTGISRTTTISVIFGTRPEAIKLAPVIRALKDCDGIRCHVCVTAQHREMLDQVLEIFQIVPDVDLDLMEKNQTLGGFTSRAIGRLDRYMGEHSPDMVLVQGDTTTVFCAALAAFYHKVPVGHVEAGLRTGNIYAPWPEEINRVITSRLATIHFAPTETSRGNLLREGVPGDRITVTGNTVIDALLYARGVVRSHPPEIPSLPPGVIRGWGNRPLVLITGHRRENFGEGFESICRAIAELGRMFPEAVFVYPVHLNPNVREPVNRLLSGQDNIFLIEPLAYLPFVWIMDRSSLVLTDSGGVQEEAPSLGKPVLVMRDTTERPEGVDAGTARLVGTDFRRIVDDVSRLLTVREEYAAMSKAVNPYGDGHAAERILEVLLKWFRSPK
jgi:UDP-N-acetylglucosamine 2-epimerase (non-hydrolysing)